MPYTGSVLPGSGYHGYHVLRPATAPGFAYKVYLVLLLHLPTAATEPYTAPFSLVQLRLRALQLPLDLMSPRLLLLLASSRLATAL